MGEYMSAIQQNLINDAIKAFHEIFPCSSKSTLEECFTIFNRKCLFWFNTEDKSTHLMAAELPKE
jgi:hypothetical protein